MSLGLTISNPALIANARPWFPVEDSFNRADGSLGATSDGTASWTVLTGNFIISSQKAMAGVTTSTGTPADSAIAYIDLLRSTPVEYRPNVNSTASLQATQAPASNVIMSANVSPNGGDALYFRIQDANNWHRVLLDNDVISESTVNGYYEYKWASSLGSATFISPFKDTKKYFPSQTTCRDTTHNHLSVTGDNEYVSVFDPAVRKWGKYPYIDVKRGIRQGAKGDDVKYLQGVLKYVGYNVAVDGDFGEQTDDALRKLQRQNNLIVDGYAWNLQTWLLIDKLAFDSLATDTAAIRNESGESVTSYVRRVLLGTEYNWPNKEVWGTSNTVPPSSAYVDVTHSHQILMENCRHLANAGDHVHYATNTYTGVNNLVGEIVNINKTVYRLKIQKCVNGTISDLTVTKFFGYDNLDSDPISHLKIVAYDNYVEIYINNQSNPCMATWQAVPNPLLTYHGIGRGASEAKGTSIDNFYCSPLEYFSVPSP